MISMSQPTSLRRQPHVLPAAADGQRELVLGDEHDGPAEPRVELDVRDLGRLQGVRDHHLQRVVPADDVDALAVDLVDDVLDPAAADADAGPDAVHLHVDGRDGDLRAVAGLAGDLLDLDGPVLDLGDLLLEQGPDEVRVAAAQDDLDAVALLADVHDDGLDPVVDVVRLARDLLAAGQDGLDGAAGRLAVLRDGDDGRAGVHPLDGGGDQLALAGLELVEDAVGLGLADLLGHHLPGGLGGDAAEELRLDHLLALLGDDLAGRPVDVDEDVHLVQARPARRRAGWPTRCRRR